MTPSPPPTPASPPIFEVHRLRAPATPNTTAGVKRWADDERPYIIHAEKLEKIYDIGTPRETRALRGINLDISLGEIVLIFGASGSGKSTLLNILAALDTPTSGLITVDNKDLAKLTYKQQVEYHQFKIGMVFQSYNLIPNLTVMQNITMPARLAGFKRKEYTARGKDLLKQFQLEKIHDRLAANLSGGQQQRVAIMRSLMNRPAMIIADEPTGNLDSENSRMMMDIFKRLNEEMTTTMLIVSHDPSLFDIADRVVHILDGKVTKQTILSTKAKVDPKTIDVPIDWRLTPEEKEQLLRELGAKTAYKDKNKQAPPTKAQQVDQVRDQAKIWRTEEAEMATIKKTALARLAAQAKQAAAAAAKARSRAEADMQQLKTLSLQRVQIKQRATASQWRQEDKAMQQLKVMALQRVQSRRQRDVADWQQQEQAMRELKKKAVARLASSATHNRAAWAAKETDMVLVKKASLKRLAAHAKQVERALKDTWAEQEKEMSMVKRLALARLKQRDAAETERTRETIRRAARSYGRTPKGAQQSSFARLVTHHKKLVPAEQRILAVLLVLLNRQQQDALSDEQIWRIFFAIDKRLSGEYDYNQLLAELDRSVEDNGVGLYRQTAEHVATGLETMLQIRPHP